VNGSERFTLEFIPSGWKKGFTWNLFGLSCFSGFFSFSGFSGFFGFSGLSRFSG